MGDKSPKSTKKKANQKEVKATEARRQRKAADDAKHVVPPRK